MAYSAADAVGQPFAGLAVVCLPDGTVLQTLHDGVIGEPLEGRRVVDWIDEGSCFKWEGFLAEVGARGAAFQWEINARPAGHLVTLVFSGYLVQDRLLLMAARTRNGVSLLYEELLQISNEQVNAFRAVVKAHDELRRQAERDSGLYDELSRLNNELANTQRELFRANTELAQRNAELAELNRIKNQFLGMAAHDLRRPLSVIMAYSEFLQDEATAGLRPQEQEFVTRIHEGSVFMRDLIDNLLDVAQIEAGELYLERQSTDLSDLVSRYLVLSRVLAAKKQIQIELACDTDLPRVSVDRNRITQVLDNLVGNATKFSPPGAVICITLECHGSELRVSVKDQGVGIAPEQLNRLFRPFSRLRATGTQGEPGTGLGLVICRKVVESHGGHMGVESQLGAGSTFWFTLPLEECAE